MKYNTSSLIVSSSDPAFMTNNMVLAHFTSNAEQKSGEPIRLPALAGHVVRIVALFVPLLGYLVIASFVTQAINGT